MSPVAVRLWRYFLPYWRLWLGAILLLLLVAASETALAALLKPLTNGLLQEHPQDNLLIAWLPLWLILLFVPRSLANFYASVWLFLVSQQAVATLRNELFQHFTQLPSAFFAKHSSGTLISRFSYDLEQIASSTRQALVTVVRDSFMALGLVLWLLWLSWFLTLALLFLIPLALFFLEKLQKRLRQLSAIVQNSQGALGERLEGIIVGEKILKAHASHAFEQQAFTTVHENFLEKQKQRAQWDALILPLLEFFSIGVLVIFLLVIGRDLQNNFLQLDAGSIVSYSVALLLLFPPLKRLAKVQGSLQTAYAAAAHIFALLALAPESDPQKPQENKIVYQDTTPPKAPFLYPPPTKAALRLEEVYFRYANTNKTWILENVSFALTPGESVGLVGGSGSGKSTLLALIPRFYHTDCGEIFLNDYASRQVPLGLWREQMAYVGQDAVVFPGTIAENIAYGQSLAASALRRAAQLAYVHEFADVLPEGLATKIGSGGLLLSGGQKQRLALARALAKDAPLLLLDEPTSALDNQLEALIMENLYNLGKTVLLSTHRLQSLKQAQQLILLEQGKICAQGSHQQLLENSLLYQRLWQSDEIFSK